MSEINEIDKLVLVDVPKVIENEQIYVYVPIAVGDKPGLIAIPAGSNDFVVENGYLKLKWDIDKLLATKLDVPDRGKASRVFTVNDQGKVAYVPYSASQIIVGELSIPMRTVDGDLIVRDTPTDKHAAVNQQYVDKRDNELDAAINTKLNKSSTPGIVYANTDDGELSEPTEIPYTSNAKDDGESIVSRTFDGYFNVKDPLQDAHAANKKYADRIFNDGGTIKKNLNVLGDLKVQGKLVYVTGTVEGLEQQYLELNTNKTLTIGTSGLLINKGKTASGDLGTYAIVYDANKDAVVCGLGTTRVDKIDGKDVLVFEFNEGEGLPLTIRDESDKMTDRHLLQWDTAHNKLIDTGKTVSDFVPKIVPSDRYWVYTQRPLGIEDNPGGIQMIEYSSNNVKNTIAYRGADGVLRGATAPLAQQNDLDLINRGELINKLSNYEKSPNYALIEKIIVGYSLLETEPEDFTTNYSSYYKTNGKARNDIDFAYVALTEAEEFETGKYYSKATESVAINRSGSANYEPDGTRYAFNNVYAYIDSAANFKSSVFFQYYSIPSHVLLNRVYLDSSATANTHRVQFSVDVKGNMAIAEAAALVDNDKSKTIGMSKNIVKDKNFYLAGFYISPLQVDTTVLIYGVRI